MMRGNVQGATTDWTVPQLELELEVLVQIDSDWML